MKNYIYNLKDNYKVAGGTLECIVTDFPFDGKDNGWRRPAMIVVPGGAYMSVSKREGEIVANQFLARGFQVFVLNYLTKTENVSYPEELLELASAVDYIRKNADQLKVKSDEIFAVGFSAGGHLVANLAVDYKNIPNLTDMKLDCRLTGAILSYPVISHDLGHCASFDNLLCAYKNKEEMYAKVDLDKIVTKDASPCFIWSTFADSCVPCVNAISLANSLAKNNVRFELHIYPEGDHGLATCDDEISWWYTGDKERVRKWLDDAASFAKLYCENKKY